MDQGKFFKGCIPKILLGLFLNILFQISTQKLELTSLMIYLKWNEIFVRGLHVKRGGYLRLKLIFSANVLYHINITEM